VTVTVTEKEIKKERRGRENRKGQVELQKMEVHFVKLVCLTLTLTLAFHGIWIL
jgi:hypothetical protein